MTEIKVRSLKKRFGNIEALRGVDFEVKKGEIFAFLGPNGAGKTTTINILTGLILKYEGEIFYGGEPFSPHNLKFKKLIGVVPQHNNVDRDLSVEANLKVHGYLHGIFGGELKKAIDRVLEFTGLTNHKRRKADHLSGGMKRRLVIARALMHDPSILFLDEPTVGLDPAVRRSMWDLIRSVNSLKGCTVFLTTHYIEEAEILADTVVIIDNGEIVASGKPEELKKQVGKYALEIYYEDRIEEEFFETRECALERLKNLNVPAKIREVNLEDVFLKITGRRIEV